MIWSVVSGLPPKALMAVAALALAGRAVGQQAPAAGQATSDAFERACVDLFHGKAPKGGPKAIDALRDACSELAKARTEQTRQLEAQKQALAQAKAQQRLAQSQQVQPQAGKSAAQVQPGTSALAAFTQAGNELVGNKPKGMMGMQRSGQPFSTTVSTNPVGWFTGIGVNADLARSFEPQFSWIGGAHYSQSAATSNSLYTLGFLGGIDWFIIGQHNEGLRVGPRADFSFGRETSGSSSTSSRLGITGEVGYNFIASNGITGQAAFGLGGRVTGDKNTELSSGAGGEFGPYVKLGVGYSW
jgi:hypothetical protein